MSKQLDSIVLADPVERLAALRHEFGEHGGVNMSIEATTTITVLLSGARSGNHRRNHRHNPDHTSTATAATPRARSEFTTRAL